MSYRLVSVALSITAWTGWGTQVRSLRSTSGCRADRDSLNLVSRVVNAGKRNIAASESELR